MVMRINPNQQAIWRTPYEMQLGVGPDSVVLPNLTNAQERMIAALYNGIADQQLPLVTKQLGLSGKETNELLGSINKVLLNESPAKAPKQRLSEDFVAGAFAEIIRASLLHSVDGQAVLLGRTQRSIHLDHLGRAGIQVALALAAAGVGHIISHDEGKVEKADLGPNGFPSQLVGQNRIDALRSLLAASPNQTLVSTGRKLQTNKLQKIDCAVLISQQVIDPRRYSTWINRDVPHVAVTFAAEDVWVSPMIIPGQSACLFCLDKMKTQNNPSWPVIATQLLTSNKRFDDVSSQFFSAGIVVQKILSRLDKVSGFELAEENLSGYSLHLKTGLVQEFRWPKHEACHCS
jgi:molybdopterin/thiamine biosynthesis adenylyltransferase